MKIAIRADGNSTIATGHIMRCLSIAAALKKSGNDCIFIVADEQSHTLLKTADYPVIILNSLWNNLESEIPAMLKVLKENSIDKIIVDSYYATEKYLEELETVCPAIYIDDLFEIHPKISAIINYAVYGSPLPYITYHSGTKTKLLLGTKYAPLRAEFQNTHSLFHEHVSRILTTAGGADTYNAAGKIVTAAVHDSFFDEIEFHVVSGKLNANLPQLNDIAAKHNKVILHQDVKTMAELMLASDIAITAGGSTMYELCACGTPSISFSWADNQLMNVKTFAELNVIECAGDMRIDREKCIATIISLLKKYISDTELRKKRSEAMRKVTDGKGAMRIAEEIMKL